MKTKTTTFFPILMMVLTASFFVLSSCNTGTKQSDSETEAASETTKGAGEDSDFKISLAQWSLHRSFFGDGLSDWQTFGRMLMESPDSVLQGELDPMNFPEIAAGYGIYSIELVNTFYFGKIGNQAYWDQFKENCDQAGVSVGLIMCDALGNLGDADEEARMTAVENHYPWVDLAQFLGAQSIRVNAAGQGAPEEVAAHATDGLTKLAEYSETKGINVLVENHGGYSSNGEWLSGVMESVDRENVGTLPDFGNFCIERGPEGCVNEYDRYKGMAELMPYAKGVSAKSHEFDENGNEVHTDFLRMMKIVKESGFTGYVGIEYEGDQLSEEEGIKATKALLERVFDQL